MFLKNLDQSQDYTMDKERLSKDTNHVIKAKIIPRSDNRLIYISHMSLCLFQLGPII